ncbi:histidine phosphatase family protein [soil metagenome]
MAMSSPRLTGSVHLVRHGLVENPSGVVYGRLPGYNLSALGVRQAKAAAERLRDAPVGAIWASPLERAQETAQEIAVHHDVEVVTDDRLIESQTTFEGVARTLAAMLSARRWWLLRNPMKPTWGESFTEIRARMVAAIEDALPTAGGKDLVVVSHQTPIMVARLALGRSNLPPWLAREPCTTGSISTFELQQGAVVSSEYFAPAIASDD